jgi:ABC-type Fe3+/spermidine/putrescine transport system ATPase subunit
MLKISDLVTAYGKIEALKGVTLQADAGRITCLLGPNGAGKITLMMSIAGILRPLRGSVRLAGTELTGLTPARIVGQGVALVPENRLVFPQMSVRDRQMLGFDLGPWLLAMRGQTLVVLGRGEEARPYLDRVIAMNAAQVDITNHLVPSIAYVELAWETGDSALAQHHAERAFSMAVKSGSPYLRVYAQACRGLAHVTASRLDQAIEDFIDALGFARRRRAGLENEAHMLAQLANAYRINGNWDAARTAAFEAISIATARCARVPECLARIVHAETLWASADAGGTTAGEAELNLARRLLEETGAELYAPLLNTARANIEGRLELPRKSGRGGISS